MSLVSSLSLWSSIKIFSNPYVSSTRRKFPSVPYVATFNKNKHQQKEEKANHGVKEVVSLKIPQILAKSKNSSSSISYKNVEVQTEEYTLNNKLSTTNLTNFSKFSENRFDHNKELEKTVNAEDQEKIEPVKTTDVMDARKEFEKQYWDPEFDHYFEALYDVEYEETEMGNIDGKNPDWVPSVKPWTLQELEKVNELFNTMEENIKKIEMKAEKNRKKKKHTLKKDGNDFKAPSCYCLSQGDPQLPLCEQSSSTSLDEWIEIFYDCEFSQSESDSDAQFSTLNSAKIEFKKRMEKLSEENYYKSKLAQLYLIANGC